MSEEDVVDDPAEQRRLHDDRQRGGESERRAGREVHARSG
jgi:hypothetical protein